VSTAAHPGYESRAAPHSWRARVACTSTSDTGPEPHHEHRSAGQKSVRAVIRRAGASGPASITSGARHGTPAELRPVVVPGDGAKWIWEHVATLFGEERTEIVDWYHASEHICTVAKAVHGDNTPETKGWAKTALDHLWQTGPEPVLDWFAATQPGSTAAGAVVQRERGYFGTNAARMQYPSFREQQLPIGSGAAEASAKHLVEQRMKRAGSRWSDLGARAILDLRCHLLSGSPNVSRRVALPGAHWRTGCGLALALRLRL
jgi:hypothetical protein